MNILVQFLSTWLSRFYLQTVIISDMRDLKWQENDMGKINEEGNYH